MVKIVRVPEKAAKASDLSFTDIATLYEICKYANKSGYVEYRHITAIAKSLGVNKETVCNAVKSLTIKGYIVTRHQRLEGLAQIQNQYQILNMKHFVQINNVDRLEGLPCKELGFLIKLKAKCLNNSLTVKFKSKKELGELLGVDYRILPKMLSSLEDKGYISQKKKEITLLGEIFEDLDIKTKTVRDKIAELDFITSHAKPTGRLIDYCRAKARNFEGINDLYSWLLWIESGAKFKAPQQQQEYITM